MYSVISTLNSRDIGMLEVTFNGTQTSESVIGWINPNHKIVELKRYSKLAKRIKAEIKALNRVKKYQTKHPTNFCVHLDSRIYNLSVEYSQTTQNIYNLKKELGYLPINTEKPILKNHIPLKPIQTNVSDKCLYQTPEVVGRMVEINCSAACLSDRTCDDFIIGYVIDYYEVENEYLVEIPELSGTLHDGINFTNLKLSGRKYWYCNRDWFEFVD